MVYLYRKKILCFRYFAVQNNYFGIPSKIPRKTFMTAFGSFVFGSVVKFSKIDNVHRRSHLRCSATLLKKRLQHSCFTLKFANFLWKPLVAASFFRVWACLRSSLPEVFCKKGVPRNFTKFTGKHLCQSLFFNKVACLRCRFV